jgi:type I restriction enzyme, S subunit
MQVSIVYKNSTVSDFRIDAEAYLPIYIDIEKILKNKKFTKLGNEISIFKKGIFDIKAECYCDNGKNAVPFVRISNLKNMITDDNDIIYIPEEENEKNKQTFLKRNDIILSKTAYPACSLVTLEYCNTYQDTIAVKLKKDSQILSQYLVIFLNSKYGYYQMKRWFTGNIQMHLNLTDGRGILIPVLADDYQELTKKLFCTALIFKENSKSLYRQAEELLLQELGLLNWQPKHVLTFIENYSEAQKAERIDAEYYQPKYDEIINAVKGYKGGWDSLNNVVSIKKCIEVGSDAYTEEGIPFLRVSNLSKLELNENNQQSIKQELYKELAENFQPKKGEILLSKDGTAGLAYHINSEPKKMIPCGGILRLKVKNKEYLPEYLTLVLNSLIVQEQIERVSSGALIKHWLLNQINNTVIPKLEIEKQKIIVAKIQESFKCRELSKQLLEIAKLGVEKAIEENEETAEKWIKQELGKLGVEV